jgi:DeoR/GlpR family transcriptional regulator of sugar metabolism
MLSHQRQEKILEFIGKEDSVLSKSIAEKLSIPMPTLWRDLNTLAAKGKIVKTHGGATIKKDNNFELLFSNRLKKNVNLKKKIAEKAAEFVFPGDVIAIDTGTTAMLLAAELKDRENITVVTTSFCAAQELIVAKGVCTIFLGGNIHEESMSTSGPITLQHIETLNVNKFFMSTVAVDIERGTQEAYFFDSEIKKALMDISEQKILLADSNKFGKKSLVSVAAVNDLDMIITDKNLNNDYVKKIKNISVELIKV